ncbi:hypothetical protein ACHAWF_004015 [Thalassiosira exigua]
MTFIFSFVSPPSSASASCYRAPPPGSRPSPWLHRRTLSAQWFHHHLSSSAPASAFDSSASVIRLLQICPTHHALRPTPSSAIKHSTMPSGGMMEPVVYAKEFNVAYCGKFISTSKCRIRWRFGFANTKALEAGKTGVKCRGKEHDVTVIWSKTGGKVVILCDKEEVHFKEGSDGAMSIVNHNWKMRGGHDVEVRLSSSTGSKSRFELFVNGRDFYQFQRLATVGLKEGTYDKMSPLHRKFHPWLRDPGRGSIFYAEKGAKTGKQSGWGAQGGGAAQKPVTRDVQNQDDSVHNEHYLREVAKSVTVNDAKAMPREQTSQGGVETPVQPKMSKAGSQLLIDFLSDWDTHG